MIHVPNFETLYLHNLSEINFFYKPIITLNFTRVLYTLMARIYLNKTRIFTIFRDFLPLRHVNLTGHNLDISTQVL